VKSDPSLLTRVYLALGRARFSLSGILVAIAAAAVWAAASNLHLENLELRRNRDALKQLARRLRVSDPTELARTIWPKVADNYETYEIFIPDGQSYDLHLAVGVLTKDSLPIPDETFSIGAGRHRVTTYVEDSLEEGYHITIYVDGEVVIDKSIDSQWMPKGWNSAEAIRWTTPPPDPKQEMQLQAVQYSPHSEFELFGLGNDQFMSMPGYRIWIDASNVDHQTASPFIGRNATEPESLIGLRDGLRYQRPFGDDYEWSFTCPMLAVTSPVIRLNAEFMVNGESVLSKNTVGFQGWRTLRVADSGDTGLRMQLKAELATQQTVQPVVELLWDLKRPDSVGLRVPDVQANRVLDSLRLRIENRPNHLWREISTGKGWRDVRQDIQVASNGTAPLELSGDSATVSFRWRTDYRVPLQYLGQPGHGLGVYYGLSQYPGLPTEFALEIPTALAPKLEIETTDQHPAINIKEMPDGRFIEAIVLDVDATLGEWIWLTVKPIRTE